MEASWRKIAAYLLFFCTVVSAVRMPYRRDFHRRQHVTADRTALTRIAVVPPPNIPHTEGSPPRPVHQPWYYHIGDETRGSHTRTPRVHKHFDEITVHNIGSRPESQHEQEPRHRHKENSHKKEISKTRETKVVDETNIPNMDALLVRHAKRMNQLKRRMGRMNKMSGRRGGHSRRKLSSFKKGCRMRRACSIRTVHYRPVCGSDGVMYDNKCMLRVAACMKGSRHAITATRSSVCQKQGAL